MSPRPDRLGPVAAAAGPVLAGTSVVATDAVLTLPVAVGHGARYLAAGLVLAVAARAARTPRVRIGSRGWVRLAAVAGAGQVGYTLFAAHALRTGDAAFVGAVAGTAPLGVLAVDSVRHRTRPRRPVVLGVLLAVTGVVLTQGAGAVSWGAVPAALGLTACEVVFSVAAAPLLATLGPLRVAARCCLLAGAAFAPWALAHAGSTPAPGAGTVAALAWLSLAATAVGSAAWFLGVSRIGASRAAVFLGLAPVGTLGALVVTGGGPVTAGAVLGCLVAGSGVGLALAAPAGRRRSPGPAPARSAPSPDAPGLHG